MLLRAGVSKQAIEDALDVAFLFNIYDRLADTMGWDVPSRESGYYQLAARRLLERGYLCTTTRVRSRKFPEVSPGSRPTPIGGMTTATREA